MQGRGRGDTKKKGPGVHPISARFLLIISLHS